MTVKLPPGPGPSPGAVLTPAEVETGPKSCIRGTSGGDDRVMSLMPGRAPPENQDGEKSRGRPFSGKQQPCREPFEIRGKGDPLWLTVLASRRR